MNSVRQVSRGGLEPAMTDTNGLQDERLVSMAMMDLCKKLQILRLSINRFNRKLIN